MTHSTADLPELSATAARVTPAVPAPAAEAAQEAPLRAWLVLVLIALVGLSWAGRRYRRMAGEEPTVTGTPSKRELYALARGLVDAWGDEAPTKTYREVSGLLEDWARQEWLFGLPPVAPPPRSK